jgi:hypothetical protein
MLQNLHAAGAKRSADSLKALMTSHRLKTIMGYPKDDQNPDEVANWDEEIQNPALESTAPMGRPIGERHDDNGEYIRIESED